MKKNIFLLISIILLSQYTTASNITNYCNDSFINKTELSQAKLVTISHNFSYGSTTTAFNNVGKEVPFLQQYGSEEMLKRFTNPTLDRNDVTTFGKGIMTGSLQIKQLEPTWSYNFSKHWRAEFFGTIQETTIKDITIQFDMPESSLTADQKTYLQKLRKEIPTEFQKFGFSEIGCLGVFNHTFEHFKNMDFIDLTIKTGFIAPESTEKSQRKLFASPLQTNDSFRYPILGRLSVGVLDWITFGASTSLIFSQETQRRMPINHTSSKNSLLISESTNVRFKQGALISASLYIEADHIADMVSVSLGYNYTQHQKDYIYPINKNEFSTADANKSKQLEKWSKSSIYFQTEIDFATTRTPNAPILKINYNLPLKGRYTAKTRLWSGSFGLQLCYNF